LCPPFGGHYSYLQIDHRIPYEVAGDNVGNEQTPEDFMLLSASLQRQKSWTCEHCINGTELKNPDLCRSCFWALPESYSHIAMEEIRQVQIVWTGTEAEEYEAAKYKSYRSGLTLQEYIKTLIKKNIRD